MRAKTIGTWLGTLLLGLALAMAPAYGAENGAKTKPPYLRVSGSGTASAAPDRAEIDVGVMTEAETAEKAAEENARRQEAVIRAVRKELGEKADVRTTAYSVTPRYEHHREGAPRLAGYQASNVVRVRTDDLDRVGDVLDAATKGGANQIHGVNFSLKDESALRAQALREAVRRARKEADAIAEAMEIRIGPVRAIEASPQQGPIVPMRSAVFATAEAAAPPIEKGTIDISADVVVTYDVTP